MMREAVGGGGGVWRRRMGRGWIEEEQGRRERVKQVGGGRGCYAMTMGTSSEKPLIIGSSSSSSPEEGRKKENQSLTSLLCDLTYVYAPTGQNGYYINTALCLYLLSFFFCIKSGCL